MEQRHWKIVEEISNKYPYTFYAFESRAKRTQKRFSDLDLYFKDPIPFNVQGHIEEDFEESDLPFKPDVFDLSYYSSGFQEIIEEDLIPIQRGTNHAN